MKKRSTVKYYTSIEDLPIYNWKKINETNDLGYVFQVYKKQFDKIRAKKAWDRLYAEYIDTFGINEKYLELLETQRELLMFRVDFAVTKDRFLLNEITKLEIDLQRMQRSDESKLDETTPHIEKHFGFMLDETKVSVKKYYTYLGIMKKEFSKKAA